MKADWYEPELNPKLRSFADHHPIYIYAMRQAGFKMFGYRTTLAATLDWLAKNPDWREKL